MRHDSMMPGSRYIVRFRGALLPGYTVERAQSELVEIGGVKPETARQLFARGDVVVGRDVSAGQAKAIASRLRAAGLVVEVEPSAIATPAARATALPPEPAPASAVAPAGSRAPEQRSIPLSGSPAFEQPAQPAGSVPLSPTPAPELPAHPSSSIPLSSPPAVQSGPQSLSSIPLARSPDPVPTSQPEQAPAVSAGHGMQCPKCGAEQPRATTCVQCGVIVEKYLALKAAADATPLPGAAPAPGPAIGTAQIETDVTELTLAPRGVRLAAKMLDSLLVLLCLIAILAPTVGWVSKLRFMLGGGVAALLTLFCVQMVMLTARGQTVGKMALGIRIVRAADGSSPGFLRAVFLRSWLNALLGAAPGVYQIVDAAYILTTDSRCVHDLIAGTIVVDADDADAQLLRILTGTRIRQALLIVALVGVHLAVAVKASFAVTGVHRQQDLVAEAIRDGAPLPGEDADNTGGGGPDYTDLFSGLLLLAIVGGVVVAIRRLRY